MPRRPSPPATLLLLVRHGQTPTTGRVLPGRAPGLHLTPTGTDQAAAAAARIAELPGVEAVYASPLERARETAAPIARAVGRRVRVHSGLNECDFGEWTGAPLARLRRRRDWSLVQNRPSDFRFPRGESFRAMQVRIASAARDLVERHGRGVVVAVSHADPIKALAADALGLHLDMFQRIVVSPCSITAILYLETGPVVLTMNSTGDDLSALAPS